MSESLDAYLRERVRLPHPVLEEMEARGRKLGFPIVGPLVGNLLYQLALLVRPRRVFELGSGFGYSGMWFALAMPPEGVLTLTDYDPRNLALARRYFARAALPPQVRFLEGDALSFLEQEPPGLDIIFNDIEKARYPEVVDLALEKLRPGGLLISDNAFFFGRVMDSQDRGADVEGIRAYTRKVFEDPHWHSLIVPLRDGVFVSYRVM